MNRLWLAALLLAACAADAHLAAALGLSAAAPRIAEPAAGARLTAGAPAVALFDLTGVPLDGIDEMELVLSLDGGQTFPHCVSRDLPPGASRAVWTAPDLSASRAVLGVRTGGRGKAERVVAVSAPFEIVAPEPKAPPAAGGALAPGQPALGPSGEPEAALEQIPVSSPSADGPSVAVPALSAGPAREPRPSVSSGPLFLPRRE